MVGLVSRRCRVRARGGENPLALVHRDWCSPGVSSSSLCCQLPSSRWLIQQPPGRPRGQPVSLPHRAEPGDAPSADAARWVSSGPYDGCFVRLFMAMGTWGSPIRAARLVGCPAFSPRLGAPGRRSVREASATVRKLLDGRPVKDGSCARDRRPRCPAQQHRRNVGDSAGSSRCNSL